MDKYLKVSGLFTIIEIESAISNVLTSFWVQSGVCCRTLPI